MKPVAAALSYSAAQPALAAASNSIVVESVRPPDTTDTRGPYEILLRQVAGPALTRARLVYKITGAYARAGCHQALR